ncbi:MAG: RNA recognition motif domain-containing protein [Tepidiformaceae bacterium]
MKIYVGNLSFRTSDRELEEVFATHGAVESAQVVMDRGTGQSRGFGFVEMANQTEAENAIRALNGTDLGGRMLNVSEAKPREESGGRSGGGGGRGGSSRY